MPDGNPPTSVPESKRVERKRRRVSFVWIIPIVAAAIGAWVAIATILSEGPKITITFHSAEGLEAGKTKIHYNGVEVGTLSTIRLSEDHKSVIATAQMAPDTDDFLVDGTQFWVVRPRISGANVSGLGTLISGSYIGMEIGASKQKKHDFVALAAPPVIMGDVPGRFFVLKASNLGSLDYGTPIYFRRLQVGQVASYELEKSGEGLTIRIFVKAPYDQYVSGNTRFWQASGIDVSLSASGISVQTQSLLSILVGGIAFETSATEPVLPPADAETVFRLYNDRDEAFRPPVTDPQSYRLMFSESVHGLTPGAPVEFRGIKIGEVADVEADFNPLTATFQVPVTVRLEPRRFGVRIADLPQAELEAMRRTVLDTMVAHGARAQLRTGSLITGALYVAFDFFPDAAPATIDWSSKPPELPTIPGDLQAIEANVVSIIRKLDQIPFKSLGDDARKTFAELDKTLVSARGTLDNAGDMIRPDSTLDTQLSSTLQEVSGAARSLRILTDYLERHPEALLRGKSGEAK